MFMIYVQQIVRIAPEPTDIELAFSRPNPRDYEVRWELIGRLDESDVTSLIRLKKLFKSLKVKIIDTKVPAGGPEEIFNHPKVIEAIRNNKTGKYTFKEEIKYDGIQREHPRRRSGSASDTDIYFNPGL